MMIDTNNDKRKRLRIDFETTALLKFETMDLVLEAKMKNISMNGIFVETERKIPVNTACEVEVVITAPHSKLTMQTEGFVSRHDPAGLGVQFQNNMEWFAFFSIFDHYGKDAAKK